MRTQIINLDETDSTNDEIKRRAAAGAPDGLVVIAKSQTAGRGRSGKPWTSGDGGLFFSVLLRPTADETQLPGLLTLVAGVAASQAFRDEGLAAELKWPNDVLFNGKKLCGILAEGNVMDGKTDFAVLGMGMNINTEVFPPELMETATSIFLLTGAKRDARRILENTLNNLDALRNQLQRHGAFDVITVYKDLCMNIGKTVILTRANSERITGIARDIDENGGLIVQTEDGVLTVTSGEVSLR